MTINTTRVCVETRAYARSEDLMYVQNVLYVACFPCVFYDRDLRHKVDTIVMYIMVHAVQAIQPTVPGTVATDNVASNLNKNINLDQLFDITGNVASNPHKNYQP
jgi:hypothetical protein